MDGEYSEHAVDITLTATIHEQANQETEETRDLMHLFSLDLGHLPCLAREEECLLACQARNAWQGVLERLREQHSLVTALLAENKRAFVSYDSLSEPDVLPLLDYVGDQLRQLEQEEVRGPVRKILRIWLCRVRCHSCAPDDGGGTGRTLLTGAASVRTSGRAAKCAGGRKTAARPG
jgi:hypothetical protein